MYRVFLGEGSHSRDASEIVATPSESRVIIDWPDGVVHIGVPPRWQEDIPPLYRLPASCSTTLVAGLLA